MLFVTLTTIIIVDLVCLVCIWLSSASVPRKLLWAAVTILLPIAGAVFYFVMGNLDSEQEA